MTLDEGGKSFTVSKYKMLFLEIQPGGINDASYVFGQIDSGQSAPDGKVFFYDHSILSEECKIKITGLKFTAVPYSK
jgi:hypothetical protein